MRNKRRLLRYAKLSINKSTDPRQDQAGRKATCVVAFYAEIKRWISTSLSYKRNSCSPAEGKSANPTLSGRVSYYQNIRCILYSTSSSHVYPIVLIASAKCISDYFIGVDRAYFYRIYAWLNCLNGWTSPSNCPNGERTWFDLLLDLWNPSGPLHPYIHCHNW